MNDLITECLLMHNIFVHIKAMVNIHLLLNNVTHSILEKRNSGTRIFFHVISYIKNGIHRFTIRHWSEKYISDCENTKVLITELHDFRKRSTISHACNAYHDTSVLKKLFFSVKIMKSGSRSKLNAVRLERCVLIAASSISTNIDQLAAEKQWPFFFF